MVALMALAGETRRQGGRTKSLGVFCLESWGSRLTDRTSVRPLLEVLSGQTGLRFIHRFADSREQLYEYLERWAGLDGYPLGYFACHGDDAVVHYGSDRITLSEIAARLEAREVSLGGKTLYFGSCAVLAGHGRTIESFRRRIGAEAVCGYRGEEGVDWLESAAFELLLFDYLASSPRKTSLPALRQLENEERHLARKLDFAYFPRPRRRPQRS
jgi:hypothetical protein